MNHFYGIRLKPAFESEAAWYRINAYGGKALAWWSLPMLTAGILTLFLPVRDQPALVAVPVGAYIFPLVAVLQVARHAGSQSSKRPPSRRRVR